MDINLSLDNLKVAIQKSYNKQLDEYGYVIPEKIRNQVLGLERGAKTLIEFIETAKLMGQLKLAKAKGTNLTELNRIERTQTCLYSMALAYKLLTHRQESLYWIS
ncbi:hypothetical protein [Dysgonomonas sp. BGC7]|uniref:hypothetical protein n=1 Tax=Dysgonomonas sp. BGC7 TaxID=1658008 RepID=UPI000A91843D|nr:hypothetical protein [Dysgonomonas sp. BGC7]